MLFTRTEAACPLPTMSSTTILFTNLLLSGKLDQHLAEIDQACIERVEHIAAAMAKAEGVTEALKASDQMKWVGCMNNIHNRAEEMVLSELIYT